MRYNDIYSRQFQWTLKWNIIIFQNWLLPFMYFLPWLLNYIVFFIKLFSRNLNLNQNTEVCLSMPTSCFYVTYPFWWWTIMDLHSFLFFVTLSNISIVLTPCSAFLYSSSLGRWVDFSFRTKGIPNIPWEFISHASQNKQSFPLWYNCFIPVMK